MTNIEIQNAALDLQDERLYKYKDIAWNININELPIFKLNDYKWIIQDQYKDWYNMGCVYYSVSMHDNYLNFRDWINELTKWYELCNISSTRSNKNWDLIINWPKLMKELNYIKWYFGISSVNEALHILSQWENISTGSNLINWNKTRTGDYYAQWDSWPGHAFTINWFNRWDDYIEIDWRRIPPKCLTIRDSSYQFNNWYFYLRLEDFDKLLYSTKVYFTNDTTLIDNYKRMILKDLKLDSAKLAFLLWLTNWERPNDNITREESMALSYRIVEGITNGTITKDSIEKAKKELARLS